MATSGKNERVFDQRVVHRNITAGRVTREEYQAYLASLTDCAENIKPREEGGDDDGYDRPIAAANEPSRRPLGLLPLAPSLSLLAGIVGLAFVGLMVVGDSGNPAVFGPIGHGGAERMIVYPVMLWMLVFGSFLMADQAVVPPIEDVADSAR